MAHPHILKNDMVKNKAKYLSYECCLLVLLLPVAWRWQSVLRSVANLHLSLHFYNTVNCNFCGSTRKVRTDVRKLDLKIRIKYFLNLMLDLVFCHRVSPVHIQQFLINPLLGLALLVEPTYRPHVKELPACCCSHRTVYDMQGANRD